MRQYKSNHVSRSVEEQDGLLAAEYDERKREKKRERGRVLHSAYSFEGLGLISKILDFCLSKLSFPPEILLLLKL